MFVVGLNSVRAWRHQSGGVRQSQLDWAADGSRAPPTARSASSSSTTTCSARPGARGRSPSPAATTCSPRSSTAGAELILAGHIHQAAVSERREFEISAEGGGERSVTVSIAPGLGQPRPNRRGEARGLHVYEASDAEIDVTTFVWREDGWALTALGASRAVASRSRSSPTGKGRGSRCRLPRGEGWRERAPRW